MPTSDPEIDLFDFGRLCAFPGRDFDDLSETDPIWALNASTRRDALFAEKDKSTVLWLVRVAEYLRDGGSYTEAFAYSNRARDLAVESGDRRMLARSLACHCDCEIATGDTRHTAAHINELRTLAGGSSDPYLDAVLAYVEGCYAVQGEVDVPDTLHHPMTLLQDAATLFQACGEPDLSVLASIECANAIARTGHYIGAIKQVESAMEYAAQSGAWMYTGRLLLMACVAAADQGYRRRVEETLNKAIKWCQFVGDFWGSLQGWYAIGRLLSYQIPSRDPSAIGPPERFLRLALEEADAHGAAKLAAQIEASLVWLYDKAGIDSQGKDVRSVTVASPDRDQLREEFVTQNSVISRTISVRISARLQDGIEDSPDPFYVFDARRTYDGKCVDFLNEYRNPAGSRLLGLGPGSVFMFSESKNLPAFEGLTKPLFDATELRTVHQDLAEVREGETTHWFRRRIVPSGDGAVITLRDVTAEHLIQDALREAAESAKRSDLAKSEFLANTSHEIRTPLNGVLGIARLLAGTELDPVQRSYVADIIGSGDILLNVIGDILDLSKIESRSMHLELEPTDLSKLIAGTVRLYQGQALEKGVELTCMVDDSMPRSVMADGSRLKQILANLIGNSVKFTPEGSIVVSARYESGSAILDIRDTGIGIPADKLESVFNRFEQATLNSVAYGGTGLGLTLTKGLVELMGGHISAESTLGSGSRFTVRLPLDPVAEREARRRPVLPTDFEGRRILLVEDNRVNVVVSREALARLGCIVKVAYDGREALETLEREGFELIFMDVRMPVMDGLEATRELRSREGSGHRTPVVALTAGALLEEREECFLAGMDAYLSKPFGEDALREILAEWLP